MRAVIFDLDGTLADTSGDLLAAANAAFTAEGLGAPLTEGDAGVALKGGRAMLRLGAARLGLGWNEEEISRRYQPLLDAYEGAIDHHTVLYPGAVAAIDGLKSQGIAVGICTNKPDYLAEKLLKSLGVRDLFGTMVGANTLPVRKPDPAPLRLAIENLGARSKASCLIGDTDTDRLTGRAAGVPVVLVTFGPGGEAVRALEPEALLDHFDALGPTVLPLIS